MGRDDVEIAGGEKKGRGNYSPADDSGDRQRVSWLIPMFVLANVVVFGFTMYVNNCPKHSSGCFIKPLGRFSFQPFRENPLGPSTSVLRKMGGLEWDKVVHHHQGWRLLTCIWLHAGLIHLIANTISLLVIGNHLEEQCGFARVGVIYLLSGFGGAVFSSLFIQRSISVGASGALFGILGAMLSELITNWSIYTNKIAALLTVLVVVTFNLALGILPHVDNFNHIGGFLTGFLLGFVLLPLPQLGWMESRNFPAEVQARSQYKPHQCLLWAVSLALLISGFVVGLALLFSGVNGYNRCQWCRSLNCVPNSIWTCDAI
ncbi:unnamed protein product [Cuscuta campestris]|uniref:RHOMBOID-like protein n=2 Tax=Cuscuta sect. Cleistogrammica TaxID=1824901 RepID=A0A484K822_9ASTE|nr:hypothetical protein DM860_008410 [Cuscuta australis]VFQ58322.1 unnamed protein product [Cuscuta campestris]